MYSGSTRFCREYAPFAIAATLMVMIYAVGHISGAHFNPAVTVAVWIRGACDKNDVAPYIGTQLLGGTRRLRVPGTPFFRDIRRFNSNGYNQCHFSRIPLYFCSCLRNSECRHRRGNQRAIHTTEVAIAFVVLAGALTVGEISGGSFNPAVTGALYVSGVLELSDLWIHLVPQFLAGFVAVQAFKVFQ